MYNQIKYNNEFYNYKKSRETLFVLGAFDPEMEEIKEILIEIDAYFKIIKVGGENVRPYQAYDSKLFDHVEIDPEVKLVVAIENGYRWVHGPTVVIDHHNEGDPGYGLPPSKYWPGSSVGQLCSLLGITPWQELKLVAAADHCLAAAYRGECPGVNPEELMEWRARSRSSFQKISVEELLSRINSARMELLKAPVIPGWSGIRDMRRPDPIPELPEAAAREGLAFISGPLKDPKNPMREKFSLMNASPEQIRAFMALEIIPGLTGVYGDPERGFAGGYKEVAS